MRSYIANRVFLANEATARTPGHRAFPTWMTDRYREWRQQIFHHKIAQTEPSPRLRTVLWSWDSGQRTSMAPT